MSGGSEGANGDGKSQSHYALVDEEGRGEVSRVSELRGGGVRLISRSRKRGARGRERLGEIRTTR